MYVIYVSAYRWSILYIGKGKAWSSVSACIIGRIICLPINAIFLVIGIKLLLPSYVEGLRVGRIWGWGGNSIIARSDMSSAGVPTATLGDFPANYELRLPNSQSPPTILLHQPIVSPWSLWRISDFGDCIASWLATGQKHENVSTQVLAKRTSLRFHNTVRLYCCYYCQDLSHASLIIFL